MHAVKTLFVWFCLFLVGFPTTGHTANPKGDNYARKKATTLTYDVYAGGIHAMNANLVISTDKEKYDLALTAGTQGFLKKMANWSGKFSSNGRIVNGKAYPFFHQSSSTWKKKTESKTFKYDGKGHFISYRSKEDGKDTTAKDIDLSLAKDTTDTLSTTLRLMVSLPTTKACDGNELVFDGDRNFRLKYSNAKMETLKKTDYNIYAGEAVSCVVEVKPEKGKWRKKPRGWLSLQEQGRVKGSLPTIWFGKLEGQPDMMVPVKIRIKTDYGTLFMHLTSSVTR